MNEILYKEVTDFASSPELDSHLAFWSRKTLEEPELLHRSVEFFREKLLHAVLVFSDERLVGVSGTILCPDRRNESIYHRGRPVAELMGRYVEPSFRGLGREMILRRLRFARNMNLFPISVTKNSYATETFLGMGAYLMTHDFGPVYGKIRFCECMESGKKIDARCPTCPLYGKSIWALDHILDQHETRIPVLEETVAEK